MSPSAGRDVRCAGSRRSSRLPDGALNLLFVRVPEGKSCKNRLHLDFWPTDQRRDDEVARLLEIGASLLDDRRNADGSGWVIFADPEGNEFCVTRSAAEYPR